MGLFFRRAPKQSWKQAMLHRAEAHGLTEDVLTAFKENVARGQSEARAAWAALYEWDLLDYVSGAEEETMISPVTGGN